MDSHFFPPFGVISYLKAFSEFSSQPGFHNTGFHRLFLRHWKVVSEKKIFVMFTEFYAVDHNTKQTKQKKITNEKNKTKILNTYDWGIRGLSLPHQTSGDPESYRGIPYRRAFLCEIPACKTRIQLANLHTINSLCHLLHERFSQLGVFEENKIGKPVEPGKLLQGGSTI